MVNNSESISKFPPGVAEKIGAYVYVLRDPESRQIFYVGKGNGDRVFAHAKGALKDEGESLKNDTIRDIIARGRQVEMYIVQHGLGDHRESDKSHAHQTESALYGLLTLLDQGLDNEKFSLGNLVAPPTFNDFGLRSVQDLVAQYGEPADVSKIPHRSMFIKPTRTWRLGMPDEELYEMTRGWWTSNLVRVNGIRYVFSIPKFIVRAVYEVPQGGWRLRVEGDRDWTPDDLRKPRVGFDGVNVSSQFPELINKSVESVYGPGQAKRPAVKYLDDGEVRKLLKEGKAPWWDTSSVS